VTMPSLLSSLGVDCKPPDAMTMQEVAEFVTWKSADW